MKMENGHRGEPHSDALLPINFRHVERKNCPICLADLNSTDETWVISSLPGAEEICSEICTELMSLSHELKAE